MPINKNHLVGCQRPLAGGMSQIRGDDESGIERFRRIANGSGLLGGGTDKPGKTKQHAQDFCNTSQAPPNVTVIEEQRSDETWCITVTPFMDLEELRSLYEQSQGIKINRLEISDGKFTYDVDVDTLSETSDFSVFTVLTWSVIMPGAPIEHNADQVDANTLTWNPTPESGIINLRAESEVPRGGFSFPPCGAALIGVGTMILFFGRRK